MITAGEVLKNKRESLGKDLNTVSSDTKIQKRFLEYIENNQYDKFDSDIFASGFIKIYSRYLGLDVDKLLAIYRRSNLKNKVVDENKGEKLLKRRRPFKLHLTPQIVAIFTLILFLLSVVGYIGYQIYKFQTPPQLTITQPTDEFQSELDTVIVKGNTESSAILTINGEKVEVDTLGYFEKEIELNEGVNTISITAKKNSSNQLEVNRTLKVIFNPKGSTPDEPIVEEKEYKIVLKVLQSSSWIKLDVDGENKISQILEPNTQREFLFEDSLTLVTGRVQSTQLEINGEKMEIKSSQNSGVGQITCQITPEGFKCE